MSDQATPAPSRLGRFCPKCGYALRGLPGEGTCPECGTDYNPQSVWKQKGPAPIGTMVGLIGIPLWGVSVTVMLQLFGLLPELGALVLTLTGLAAVVFIFLTPILMRRFARDHLPPGEVRWGMFRNAWRLSPWLLVVLVLSYAASILSAVALLTVGALLAICAVGG